MKYYKFVFFLIGILTSLIASAQNEGLGLRFTSRYRTLGDSTQINLILDNYSSRNTYYYSIGLEGYYDTAWVSKLSDINYLGKNEIFGLSPLKPNEHIKKHVSLAKVFDNYGYDPKLSKVRFYLMYYEKNDFNAVGGLIFSDKFSMPPPKTSLPKKTKR